MKDQESFFRMYHGHTLITSSMQATDHAHP